MTTHVKCAHRQKICLAIYRCIFSCLIILTTYLQAATRCHCPKCAPQRIESGKNKCITISLYVQGLICSNQCCWNYAIQVIPLLITPLKSNLNTTFLSDVINYELLAALAPKDKVAQYVGKFFSSKSKFCNLKCGLSPPNINSCSCMCMYNLHGRYS